MAISGDLKRVFEVGPVFRAENSNTRRHLCEFVGLDIEMVIDAHYEETLAVVHDMFKHIFTGLETRWARELKIVREQYPSEPVTFTDEPCIVHWNDGMEMLKEKGIDVGDGMQVRRGRLKRARAKRAYRACLFPLQSARAYAPPTWSRVWISPTRARASKSPHQSTPINRAKRSEAKRVYLSLASSTGTHSLNLYSLAYTSGSKRLGPLCSNKHAIKTRRTRCHFSHRLICSGPEVCVCGALRATTVR